MSGLAPIPTGDFEEARRGLVASFDPPVVESGAGRVVWDLRPDEPDPGFAIVTPRPELSRG